MTDHLHEAAADFYKNPQADCRDLMYAHADLPIAHEVILYAMEWRRWCPPQHIIRDLWRRHGFKDPAPFFTKAVFQHIYLWTDILRELIREELWHHVACAAATQPSAWHGHLRCATLYLQALLDCCTDTDATVLLRLGSCFASAELLAPQHVRCIVFWHDHGCANDAFKWLQLLDGERLQHAAPQLLRMSGTDHLLERCVGFPHFQQAVLDNPEAASVAADLVRPLHELDDARLQRLDYVYSGTGFAKIEWHTEQLKRNLPSRAKHVVFEPCDVHQLLLWAARHGTYHMEQPHSAYLVAVALREQPQACANCPVDFQLLLHKHRQRQHTCAKLAGTWPLPSDLRNMVALYM